MKKAKFNFYLSERLLDQGKEINFITKNKFTIGFSVIEPLSRLFEKKAISRELYKAGLHYKNDFALSSISHHSRPSWDGSAIGSSSPRSIGDLKDSQILASKAIQEIQDILKFKESEYQKICQIANPKSPPRSRKYLLLCDLILQREMSIRNAEKFSGINHKDIEERINEILQIINNYYS